MLSYLMLAMVVALGLGVSLGSLLIAYRTERAYPDFVHRSHVNRLVINPSMLTKAMDSAIRDFTGVRSVHSSDLLFASATLTHPVRVGDLPAIEKESMMQVLGSADGRYLDVDQPAVAEGRLPTGEGELFVSSEFRDQFSDIVGRPVGLGDVVELGFFQAGTDLDLGPDDVIEPLGVEPLRVVGFGTLADEVLPDGVYPRQRLIVSPDVARRFQCLPDLRADMAQDEAEREYFASECAAQYRYYSLDLARGESVDDIRKQFQMASQRLTPELPEGIRDSLSYSFISQNRADTDAAVGQANRPTTVALVAFGLAAAAATLVIFTLAMARTVRGGESDQRILLALGATRITRTAAAGGNALLAVVVGLVGAAAVGCGLSRIGPLGNVRSVQPTVGWSLPASVAVPALALSGLALVVAVALAALAVARSAGRRRSDRGPAEHSVRLGLRGGPLPMVLGVRAAIGDRRSGSSPAVLFGCVVAVTVVCASVIFGANLSRVVTNPAEYGWPWQVGVITGSGYGSADVDAVDATLGGRADVRDYHLYSFDQATRIAGSPVAVLFGDSVSEGTTFSMVAGRPAERPGEVVLGTRTADDLGVEIGDTVSVESESFDQSEATVVGTALLPAIGAFLADRSGLGRGAFFPVKRDAGTQPSFVAIRLRDGQNIDRFLDEIGPELRAWDSTGEAPFVLRTARPPEIVNVGEMRGAPLLLAATLASSLALGLAVAIAVSVRDRRRDLVILRALGLGGRSLRAAVRWQALVIVAVGLALGVPLGIQAGRFAWQQFAQALGLVPRAQIDAGWLVLVGAGCLLLALVAAHRPARSAARLQPAAVLRTH